MMLYRRKVFLALLEAFGPSLERTDFQKLLFLFCQRSRQNYYDFFPYKYGGFSFISYIDKTTLIEEKILQPGDSFQLNSSENIDISNRTFTAELTVADRECMKALVKEVGQLRGKELIRKVYLEFPAYTARSQIFTTTLNPIEQLKAKQSWTNNNDATLFTIGYEGLSVDAYLNLLVANNVHSLVDVRKNPLSRKIGFSKTRLEAYVKAAGLKYYHLPQLGIASGLRKNLTSLQAYKELFELYETEILPEQTTTLAQLKKLILKDRRVALTCFEAHAECCHRHKLVNYLQQQADFTMPVQHLVAGMLPSAAISNKTAPSYVQEEMEFVVLAG